jgi:hypothetical protein
MIDSIRSVNGFQRDWFPKRFFQSKTAAKSIKHNLSLLAVYDNVIHNGIILWTTVPALFLETLSRINIVSDAFKGKDAAPSEAGPFARIGSFGGMALRAGPASPVDWFQGAASELPGARSLPGHG